MLPSKSSPAGWWLVGLLTAIVIFQSFVPPTIGLANNGDYQKLIGRFALGPVDPKNPDEAAYYEEKWRYDPAYLWVSDNYSSELLLIWPAVNIGRLFNDRMFDLRILGAIHAALWITCFAAALPLFERVTGPRLTGWARYALPLFALFVFSDVSYVAQFNSLHTDTAACIFLAWCTVILFRMAVGDWQGWVPFIALIVSGLMFITAKPQHSLLGLPLWLFVSYAVLAWQKPARAGMSVAEAGRGSKIAALAITCVLPAATVFTVTHVPEWERQLELFNEIFANLLPRSSAPAEDLKTLGLPLEYVRYTGAYGDREDHPWQQMRAALTVRLHRRVAVFCLQHPLRSFQIIYAALHEPAAHRRPPFLANYQRETGYPPKTLARSFMWWSDFRSFWFRLAPWHILAWYALFGGMACYCTWHFRGRTRGRVAAVALLLSVQGLLALGFAGLGEIGEVDRHLWIFHVVTDMTIVLAACALACGPARPEARG